MGRSTLRQEPAPESLRAGQAGPDRTLFSRFENKYLVPSESVQAMRRWLAPFVRPDEYAATRPDYKYPICSLYLDSSDLTLYKTTVQGIKNRFKIRVRSYSEDPRMPVYCEIKRRMNGVILKRRARIDREHISTVLAGGLPEGGALPPPSRGALEEFRASTLSSRAHPVMRVRYLREAYVSRAGDPVRVTFDTGLSGCPTKESCTDFAQGEWLSVPLRGTILEIKFTERYPSWIADLIRAFELQKRSIAKYILCINRARHEAPGLAISTAFSGAHAAGIES